MITQAAKTVFLTAQATSVICARAGESENFCMKNRPLTREELRRVIDGRGNAYRLPMTFDFWRGAMEIDTGKYPGDIHSVFVNAPAPITGHELDPGFKWVNIDRVQNSGNAALDAQCFFEMEDIDEVLAHFPSPLSPAAYVSASPRLPGDNSYRLANWWYCLFERHWSLRGMENALCDFYEYPDEVHKFYRALTDFYKVLIAKMGDEYGCDGVFTSDDIGTQTSPFFSLEVFREFFKPYYKEPIDTAHAHGMHFWLHTCGNIEPFIPDFIEIGLDVLHPIQKYTMEEKSIAERYGDKICIWAGFDVQCTIPYGTPEDCEREIKYLIDTYARKDGRLILTFGNSLTPDTPPESLEAVLKTALEYGEQKVQSFCKTDL